MKILFICHANICRSFMAQEICRKLLPNADVFSRGLYANADYAIPKKVTLFLSTLGITPSPHVSSQLREGDLEKADLIFCMEKRHLDCLLDRYAQYTDKLWLLSEFALDKEQDIQDPISLTGRAFTRSASLLEKAVKKAVQRIQEGENA